MMAIEKKLRTEEFPFAFKTVNPNLSESLAVAARS
jgi:hypothetical protein